MSERLSINTVALNKRQAYLKVQPCFAGFSRDEILELAEALFEINFIPQEIIVNEDDLIDCIYIIFSGKVEVSKVENHKTIPLATLTACETIGLNETGFFSATGKRTATVKAVSNVRLLGLDVKELTNFFKNHPHLQASMAAAADKILRMQLIKQSLPFNRLSYERVSQLAEQVEEISVKAGEVIFSEGDEGNCCYLIRSGKIEIVSHEKVLAVLKPPALFGEATLVTKSVRNAGARALEDSQLLILKHEYLLELLEIEKDLAKTFMSLMIDRSRPLKNFAVTVHERFTPEGEHIYILKNPENHNYFKLSEQGYFIWQQLNGQQTMKEITLALADQYNMFAPDIVAGLISKLTKSNFVKNVNLEIKVTTQQPFWMRFILRIRKVLEARVAFSNSDQWITQLYNKGMKLIFSSISRLTLAVISVAGFFAFLYSANDTIETFNIMPHVWVLFIFLIPFTLLSVVLHELGHALTTKLYGYEIHYMGIGWYWMAPIAFTDTSDMWLSTPGQRTIVNLAGIFADIIVAGICAFLILLIANPYIQTFLWLFALFTYISAFRMLNPLQELDGYYVLMDLLDKPHLRQSAILWLVHDFPKALKKPSLFAEHKAEVIYWIVCIIFIVLISVITFFLQAFIFKILGFKPANPAVSLSLPLLMALISSLGVIIDIRNQA